MKIYVIIESKGSWDDSFSWPVIAFADKTKAEEYLVKKNQEIRQAKIDNLYSNEIIDDNDELWLKAHEANERNESSIQEIELIN